MSTRPCRIAGHGYFRHRRLRERLPGDDSDTARSDAAPLTIRRAKPIREIFGAFAGIAGRAAAGNVPTSNNLRVIDDVFPGRPEASGLLDRLERHPAIDAAAIPRNDLALKPLRDLPSIHAARPRTTVVRWSADDTRNFMRGRHVVGSDAQCDCMNAATWPPSLPAATWRSFGGRMRQQRARAPPCRQIVIAATPHAQDFAAMARGLSINCAACEGVCSCAELSASRREGMWSQR